MPRVYLTAEQRETARYDARAQRIAEGLAVFKVRQHLRNREIGRTLGIRDETVARLLDGDRTVRMTMEQMWKLEDIAKLWEEKVVDAAKGDVESE